MKKKLMILLIATLFLTMMFSTGCKENFDITGPWTLTFNWALADNALKTNSTLSSVNGSSAAGTVNIIFTGNKKSGTFIIPEESNSGVYTVEGKNVKWVYDEYMTTYIGISTDDNHMNGTMGTNSTWSATR